MKIRSLMILSNLQSLMMQSIIVSYFNIRPPQLLLDVTCLFQECLKCASVECQVCFKGVKRVFNESILGVSQML